MLIDVLVLNHNGRGLLEECLPSVVRAAGASRHVCRVAVVDNASADDSLAWLTACWPEVEVIRCPNRGLCSFNDVLAQRHARVAVLLNNDIRLEVDCLDPLIAPLLMPPALGGCPCFLTAAQCRSFDGQTYDGQKTGVRWRWGLVQATSLFSGHEQTIQQADVTASAGAAIAVDREKFLELGGFDPLYLPGRLEDLDFCYRGFLAGWQARYVPTALAYHRGAATFGKTYTTAECQGLALRNTLLFQWKNLRHPWHVVRQAGGLAARLAADVLRAPAAAASHRFITWQAAWDAARRIRWIRRPVRKPGALAREREFFRRFAPQRLALPMPWRRPVSASWFKDEPLVQSVARMQL
jgi:GT2 family glycosyltransferase